MAITRTKAATICHIESVLSDQDFIDEYNLLDKAGREKDVDGKRTTELLYEKYGITFDEVDDLVYKNKLGKLLNPYQIFSAGRLTYESENQELTATFDVNINRSDFENLWRLIQDNKKKHSIRSSKLKPPQNYELLYSIFKERIAGSTFKEIFETYQNGLLAPYDSQRTKQYKSEHELEKYYHSFYKPIV